MCVCVCIYKLFIYRLSNYTAIANPRYTTTVYRVTPPYFLRYPATPHIPPNVADISAVYTATSDTPPPCIYRQTCPVSIVLRRIILVIIYSLY